MADGLGGFPTGPTATDQGGFPMAPPLAARGNPMQQPGVMTRPHKSMAAKDPLLKKAHSKVRSNQFNKENASTPPAQRIFQLTLLTIVPLFVYVLILFLTAYQFYASPSAVLSVFAVISGLCGMQYLTVDRCVKKAPQRWKKWVGFFGAVAAVAALMVGLAIHYKYMLFFAKYTNMMKYSNVAASQPALQFEDAGSLLFTEGATVDRTRAVGYRNIRTSQTLCVAPVVDTQMGTTDPVVFFAVGVNCCGWRASFHCDDVSQPGSRGALLMLEPNQLVSPAMEWMVDEQFNFAAFEDAIDLQKSVFGVSAAKNHRMLRWVKDPLEQIDWYRKRGTEKALLSCVVFLGVAAVVIANDLVQEAQRQQRIAKEFMESA